VAASCCAGRDAGDDFDSESERSILRSQRPVNSLSILYILIGSLVVAARAPMVIAPRATLRWYDGLISTDSRVRWIGVGFAPLALAMVVLPGGGSRSADVMIALGCAFGVATAWLLLAPATYRRIAHGVVGFLESSVDQMILRLAGLLAVVVGVWMISLGAAGC